jgi:hypothetical protein
MAAWVSNFSQYIDFLNCKIIFNQQLSDEDLKEELFNKINTTGSSMSKESIQSYENP